MRQPVELLEKNRPRQDRAKRTYENILASAAELLVEVGVERISTNLIAERAGITVPALYRYFPNKYSVLHALGAAMMDRQNQVFADWFNEHASDVGVDALFSGVYDLLKQTYDATLAQPGGLEIVQSLRAVAPLQEVRLESHRLVASQFAQSIAELLGEPVTEELQICARVTVDTGYAQIEMALEDQSVPPEAVLREGARVIRLYWQDILAS
jgi:AcrR family transcriptional regulator